MDEAELEKLRGSSGLRLDAEGKFFVHGEPVLHERSQLVLTQGMHRAPNGRWATRIGREWAYVDVEDAAYFVRRIEPIANGKGELTGQLRAWLTSGEELVVDAGAIRLHANDSIRSISSHDALDMMLPSGERARLSRAAHLSLSPFLLEEVGEYFLQLGAHRHRIGTNGDSSPIAAR